MRPHPGDPYADYCITCDGLYTALILSLDIAHHTYASQRVEYVGSKRACTIRRRAIRTAWIGFASQLMVTFDELSYRV